MYDLICAASMYIANDDACTLRAQVLRQSTSHRIASHQNPRHNNSLQKAPKSENMKGGGKMQRGRGISSLASTSSLVIWRKSVCVSTPAHTKSTNPQLRPAPLSPLGSWGASVEPLLPYRTWYNATLYGKEGQEGPWEMRRWGRQGLGRDGEMRS